MKKFKIDLIDKAKIEDSLYEVQKKTWERELECLDIERGAEIAEELLDPVLFKKDRQNIEAQIRPLYNAFPSSYRGTPKQTICHIKRGKKDWFITKIERVAVQRAGSTRVVIDPSSIALKSAGIIEYLSKNLKSN
jgi:hypothetical protein